MAADLTPERPPLSPCGQCHGGRFVFRRDLKARTGWSMTCDGCGSYCHCRPQLAEWAEREEARIRDGR